MICPVCFRHCDLSEGRIGSCLARIGGPGEIRDRNYGRLTSLALDPIEKKPLREFHPGSLILSVGSYGCNLSCPFCQNYLISQKDLAETAEYWAPEKLVSLADALRCRGNIGLAFTYNEPLVGYEYVRDAAKLSHERGMLNVLVSNGTASLEVLAAVLPYIDAMNIDLKGFTEEYYRWVGGDLAMVKEFIAAAAGHCHLEITTLIVPGHNDDPGQIRELARFLAGLDPAIPLHLTRYFPRYRLKEPAADPAVLESLRIAAAPYLDSVYLGNV